MSINKNKIIVGTFYLNCGLCIEDKESILESNIDKHIAGLKFNIRATNGSCIEFGDSIIRTSDISAATFKVE